MARVYEQPAVTVIYLATYNCKITNGINDFFLHDGNKSKQAMTNCFNNIIFFNFLLFLTGELCTDKNAKGQVSSSTLTYIA